MMGQTIFLAAMLFCLPALAQGISTQARVIYCYDGDTCTVDHDILPGRDRVRVRSADAPEIKAHCASEKRLALAAKQFTTSRLVGQVVLLEDVREDNTPSGSTPMSSCRMAAISERRLSAPGWRGPMTAATGKAGARISGSDGPYLRPQCPRQRSVR